MQFAALRKKNLRVVIEPRAYEVVGGRAITRGAYGKYKNGLTIEFNEGIYETEDPKIIEDIKNHEGYGLHFISLDTEEGRVTPSAKAIRHDNDKHVLADEIASVCPECGKKCNNSANLAMHMKTHEK